MLRPFRQKVGGQVGARNDIYETGSPILALVLINLVAHFIPFERASLFLDDLARMVATDRFWSLRFFLDEMRNALDYPLVIFHNLIALAAGKYLPLAVVFVFLSSALVTVGVYLLFRELLEDKRVAFVGALLYNLLPNKLALFHTLEYTYIHMGVLLYLLSFLFFILYLKRERRSLLWGSLACYSVALFWYALGFFLPVVLWLYAWLFHPRKARLAWAFLLPAIAYLFWRSDPFGIAGPHVKAYDLLYPQTASNFLRTVPNLYLGRQMAKGILYGFYRFFFIPLPGWPLLAAASVGVLYTLWRWLRPSQGYPIPTRVAWLAGVLFFAGLAPILPTSWGGVMERHTPLSSTGFVLILLWWISRWGRFQRVALLALAAAGLVISQGTAWSQVVACRMNRAIFETLQEDKEEILDADRVLIDQYSFAQNIPYTVVQDPHNQLDTYWGVQALLGRGNPLLVRWAVGEEKEVWVVRSRLRAVADEFRFQEYILHTYRMEETSVPRRGSVLIDYARVYPRGFRNGNR